MDYSNTFCTKIKYILKGMSVLSVIGIVGEYNPFHYGHVHHIAETRKLMGENSPVVCVMSGDFIQRGEAAVYSKFARAEAAVMCGVDLVLELPLPWTLSSAEGFARGAVGLLGATGVVTHLSFGSECGETEVLETIAETLIDPLIGAEIRAQLNADEGIPFAVARQRAVAMRIGEAASQLETPNNILAVEYIKAIYNQGLNLKPVTIRRFGSGHDRMSDGTGHKSAAEIRRALSGGADISGLVPEEASAVYKREDKMGRGPVTPQLLESAVMSRLRMLPPGAFAALPDAAEGLDNRIYRAAAEECSVDAILAASKSKRYALSRIRRMVMCAALGITAGMAADTPPYARVLAANERGCALLREMNEKSRIPVITKPADVKNRSEECRSLFELCSSAHDLYVLGYTARQERRGGADWRTSPKIL